MGPFFCLSQIIFGPTSYNGFLMVDIVIEHLLQCQNLRHAVYQRQHYYAEIILQLRIFI